MFWRHSILPLEFGPIALSFCYTDQVISENFLFSSVMGLLFPRSHDFLLVYSLVLIKQPFYYFLIKEAFFETLLVWKYVYSTNTQQLLWLNTIQFCFGTSEGMVLLSSTFSAANEKSEVIMLPFSFWILPMWPTFFSPPESFIIFSLSVVWNFVMICTGVRQNKLRSFSSGLLSCIISLVTCSPSIFSVLSETHQTSWTDPSFSSFPVFHLLVFWFYFLRSSRYYLPTFPLYFFMSTNTFILRVLFYSRNVSFFRLNYCFVD